MPYYGQDVVEPILNCFLFTYYFIFSSGMLNNILSQMCGRLYFPIFLLSVGLFTLIYIDSLIVLAKLLSSLPIITEVLEPVITPVSLQLKNLTRTQREEGIIKRAEKQLLNERIRNINYKIERYHHDKCMYKKQLEEILQHDQEMWNVCNEEIQKRRELRHQRVMDRQMTTKTRVNI